MEKINNKNGNDNNLDKANIHNNDNNNNIIIKIIIDANNSHRCSSCAYKCKSKNDNTTTNDNVNDVNDDNSENLSTQCAHTSAKAIGRLMQ